MKWKTLQHNGILFPPDFKSQGIKIKINGEHVEPNMIQEEMVYQWAKKKDAPKPGTTEKYIEDPIFQKNFISDFAKTLNATLHCCFCVDTPEILIDLDVIDIGRYEDELHKKYMPLLQAIAKEYGIPEEFTHVKFGKPEKCIASIATKSKAHAVVIGSMARKGIKGKLVGNSAEKLTSYLHTDMLIVAPV